VQTVILRGGLNATINVAAATLNAGNPKAATITITGAANDTSTINLSAGNDTVTIGSAQETLNGGTGSNLIFVNAATIGAKINGGTGGATILDVTGGGTMAMGPNITHVNLVALSPATTAYNFTTNAISGLTLSDLSATTADTLVAGGASQTLGGGGIGKLTLDAANHANVTFKNAAATFNGDFIEHLVNGDAIDIAGLGFSNTGTTLGFAFNSATQKSTMSVSLNGAQKTAIALFGQYSAGNFSVGADMAGTGTLITVQHQLNLALPH